MAAPNPLKTLPNGTSGVVDGGLYVGAFQPIAWADQPYPASAHDYMQAFALPNYTDIAWARLYEVIYSGPGVDKWPFELRTSLDGGNGTQVLLEDVDLNVPSGRNGSCYWVNDHCSKVYWDYMIWYNVTGMITGANPVVYIHDNPLPGSDESFYAQLKAVELIVAYDNGSGNQVYYWVNQGQEWFDGKSVTGGSWPYLESDSTSFATASLPPDIADATLTVLSTSSPDGTYQFNGTDVSEISPAAPYNNIDNHSWDVTGLMIPGSDSTLSYRNASSTGGPGASCQVQTATLAVTRLSSTMSSSSQIMLSPGWNLVSMPLSNSSLRASDLVGNVSLGVDIAVSYSPSSGYLSYFSGAMPSADFPLMSDVGYFVHATRPSDFYLSGQPAAAHNVTLYDGWNLAGWSSFANTRASEILAQANASLVASYDPSSGYLSYYSGAVSDADFVVAAGMGYFVDFDPSGR